MTYTAEDIKLAYQHGFAHRANGQPPLEGAEVVRMVELLHPKTGTNEPPDHYCDSVDGDHDPTA